MDKSKIRGDVKRALGFRMELNYRLSAWDRLEAEPDLFVLANLLLTWMEHLKSPILDQVGKEEGTANDVATFRLVAANCRGKLRRWEFCSQGKK